ncbi:hypothetical protein, partial [Escherichia coli]|uniref:hypothetical protein n=1 Tax=Escherichia coli TaxID=562 RepID=UPI001BE4DB0D
SLHWASQPPFRLLWHVTLSNFAWQSTWHLPVTFAWHLPEQDDLHFAEQSAVGGVPLHDALHFALQFAAQCALQSALAVPPLACAWQVASQSVLQDASQLPAQL